MIDSSFLFFLGQAFSVVFEGPGESTGTFLIFILLFNGVFPFDFKMDFRSFVLVDEELEGDVEGGLPVVLSLAGMFFFLID